MKRVTISVVAVALGISLLPLVAAASSPWSWSGPQAVDRTGTLALVAVSCPSRNQCTSVDGVGQEVTFDPHSPGRTWRHMVDVRGVTIACPSTTLCVAVASDHQYRRGVAFQPRSGRILRTWRIAHTGPDSVACFSTGQCTAVGGGGREVTFDPKTGKIVSNAQVAPSNEALTAVTCPSSQQCSAVFVDDGPFGHEVTFNPISGAPGKVLGGSYSMKGLSCPSTSQCTAVDFVGDELTFNPVSVQANAAGLTAIESGTTLTGVSCPSLDQCTAVDSGGNELTFDPATGTVNAAGLQPLHTGGPPADATVVACPALTQCTAAGGAGKEATFTPASGAGKAALIDRGGPLVSISCPSRRLCVAIDRAHEFTLRLGRNRIQAGRPREIGGDFGLQMVSCASSIQCTTVDYKDHAEVTFNPLTRAINAAGTRTIDPAGVVTAVACPTTTKCVAVDAQGGVVTFNPSAGNATTGLGNLGIEPFRLSCPATDQCTAVDDQREVTFNPRPSGLSVLRRASLYQRYGMIGINGLDCPSRTECVAVAQYWDELAFHPLSARAIADGRKMLGRSVDREELNGVSCSATDECMAVDGGAGAVSFNPTSRHRPARPTIPQAAAFSAVSCSPTGRCVAVDDAGNAFVATPRKSN